VLGDEPEKSSFQHSSRNAVLNSKDGKEEGGNGRGREWETRNEVTGPSVKNLPCRQI